MTRALALLGGDPASEPRLRSFATWLVDEAVPAGGLGPEEPARVLDRHIVDSLLFAEPLGRPLPTTVLDVGSGVGLPGIPLALAFPEVSMTLLDRSQRRCDLMLRAVRIHGIENCEIVRSDVATYDRIHQAVVARASLPPDRLAPHLVRLLAPRGVAIVGLSRAQRPDVAVASYGEVLEVGQDVLDSPVWVLRMAAQ